MPDDPKLNPDPPNAEPPPKPGAPESEAEKEEEIGDFINRHILEKDTVFFEG
jgi:hypothetical protein